MLGVEIGTEFRECRKKWTFTLHSAVAVHPLLPVTMDSDDNDQNEACCQCDSPKERSCVETTAALTGGRFLGGGVDVVGRCTGRVMTRCLVAMVRGCCC